jgi:hypothetical protein
LCQSVHLTSMRLRPEFPFIAPSIGPVLTPCQKIQASGVELDDLGPQPLMLGGA